MTAPLWILHLSDLHFGTHSRFAGRDLRRVAGLVTQAASEARAALGGGDDERVGLVIVTGDIAEAARPREYEDARTFFEALLGALGLPRRRAVFVPGNHDVSWHATRRVVEDQDEEGFDAAERDRRIQQVKLRNFERFVQEFHGKDEQQAVQAIGYGASVHSFPELRVAVAALCSCERESHLRQGGYLSEAQAHALMGQWRTGEARSWVKIIAVHHNPVATAPAKVASWMDFLKARRDGLDEATLAHFMADTRGFEQWERLLAVAEDCQAQVVLHGHHYEANVLQWPWRRGVKGHTLVLSAGSWGLREDALPEGQPAMMHLLRLDAGEQEARSLLRMYEPRARAEGEVEAGHFAVDAAQPEGVRLHLCAPEGWRGEQRGAPGQGDRESGGELRDFVAAYRETLKRMYERWELGGVGAVQPGGARRPVEARLDEMYLPLRLAREEEPQRVWGLQEQVDVGRVIGPEELLARDVPMVIRGPAGSGKTTWMKWTFRRLLEMEGALPLMVELRKMAADWERTKPRGSERTLAAYLAGWIAEAGLAGWADAVGEALASPAGPRPVLLVDGWDELGDLGHEIREKLQQLLNRCPRVLAVVSSRPYGDSRPTQSEGFEVLDIQLLSDAEIAAQAERFQARVYGEDEATARASAEHFQSALAVSAEARELSRTALLLTMMLLISRDRPLPDKRHRLYEECLRNLLSARPQLREAGGAQRLREEWRPEDSEERLRVVAKLAFDIQAEGYTRDLRVPIVRSWEDLERLLPQSWRREERRGFLVWLVASAGVMVDRSDGKLMFTHMSFQEYLTAHYLEPTLEGPDARIAMCRDRMGHVSWWETLRLWAAIVEGRKPELLTPVLEALVEGEAAGFWLTGAILADGMGEDVFERWCAGLRQRFHVGEWLFRHAAARAWAGSRQIARRERITSIWPEIERGLPWLPGLLARDWRAVARISVASEQGVFWQLLTERDQRRCVAAGRALAGSSPLWPGKPGEIMLLRLWPGHRGFSGMRLQALLSLGGDGSLAAVAKRALSAPEEDAAQALDLARDLERYLAEGLARNVARYLARDWARYWTHDVARDLAQYFAQNLARYWPWEWAQNMAQYFTRDRALYWTRDWARSLERFHEPHWARHWMLHWALPGSEPWAVDLSAVEAASSARAGTRAILAFAALPPDPILHLFQEACRLSLRPATSAALFQQSLAALPPDTDPLWPALARHITRRSTPEDRALLEDLARHPEKRDPPLRWGLQYYVRGDLVLDDGTELLLDDLCDQLKLPRLPYLDDLPDELEVDLDGPEDAQPSRP